MLDATSTSPVPVAPPVTLGLDSPLPKPPAKPNLDDAEAMVRHAEARLKFWFDSVPFPSLEQLDVATQALWRITAVHKTLYLFRRGEYARRTAMTLPKEFLRSIRVMEETLDLLHPPKPRNPKPKTPESQPLPPLPPHPSAMEPLPPLPLPPLPPLPSMRVVFPPIHPPQRAPKPETKPDPVPEPAPKSLADKLEHPRPVADCPKLRNPLHTAQAAARQADKLCADSGLPDPEPTPNTPASSPEPDPTDRSHESHKSYQSHSANPTDSPSPIYPSPFVLCPSNRPPPA